MEAKEDYHFSLFQPKNEYSRRVRNIILSILFIWVVAVFGFQILLLIIQKPTPEAALVRYQEVSGKISSGNASVDENKIFISALTSVLGKSSLKPDARNVLANILSRSIFNSLDSAQRESLPGKIQVVQATRESLKNSVSDESYLELKGSFETSRQELNRVVEMLGFASGTLENDIIVSHLKVVDLQVSGEEDMARLPEIMQRYLTHNRSFLTDFKFIGFPFHYFFTSVFLLVLFILLSLGYSLRIERLQKKFKILD